MNDERIHRHDWENGRCKTCGISQRERENPPDAPDFKKSETELTARLKNMEGRLVRIESISLLLWVLLIFYVLIFRS